MRQFSRFVALLMIASVMFFSAAQPSHAASTGCTSLNGLQLVLNGTIVIPEEVTLAQGEVITVTLQTLGQNFQDFSLTLTPNGGTPFTLVGVATPGTYVATMPQDFTGIVTLSGTFDALAISATCVEPAPAEPETPTASIALGSNEAALFLAQDDNGNPAIHIYDVDADGNGSFLLDVTNDDLAPYIGNAPATNTEIESVGIATLYVLTTGEFQLNLGPDDEGKTYVIIFDDIPPSSLYGYVIEP